MKPRINPRLNQFLATALSGNDILSSTLYVSGIAITFAGVYAPVIFLIIGLVLFLYKFVYVEIVEALPINGGAYNCLLNGTSKTPAAIAGMITFLSYMATAVLSAKVGIEYLHRIVPSLQVIPSIIALLFLFLLLTLAGLKVSARIALVIFIIHLLTLVAIIVAGALFFMHGHSYFLENMQHTKELLNNYGGTGTALYLAFSASLLGVSGFESSANFVEEQQPGVFRKTLRNMLISVIIFNPLMALIVLNSLPYETILSAKEFLFADTALHIGGSWLQYIVAIDAVLVLSGAVLTSYIGVSGLISRMTYDSCLPTFLGKMNTRGAYPRIVIGFFLLCSSILLITQGNVLSLAGIYGIAFLSVMTLFGVSNLILRQSRSELKRTYRAPLLVVALAASLTFLGITGNIRINPENLQFFEIYFIPATCISLLVVYQDQVMQHLIAFTSRYRGLKKLNNYLHKKYGDIADGKFVAFVHHADRLHQILDYINRNETGRNIILVHCRHTDDPTDMEYERIKNILPLLKDVGVFSHFQFELLYIDEEFSPQLIEKISRQLNIRKNRMMIGTIDEFQEFNYDYVGGTRIIL